jgi:hypothetical protein
MVIGREREIVCRYLELTREVPVRTGGAWGGGRKCAYINTYIPLYIGHRVLRASCCADNYKQLVGEGGGGIKITEDGHKCGYRALMERSINEYRQ